jgi:hypothetical protein
LDFWTIKVLSFSQIKASLPQRNGRRVGKDVTCEDIILTFTNHRISFGCLASFGGLKVLKVVFVLAPILAFADANCFCPCYSPRTPLINHISIIYNIYDNVIII